ncbi:hypothetical protein COCOBI_02-6660 [Coccomyxa sp. Obi]|nr:hypothetical protein COCOBI_02-6660 [Coccomyxa sp. Obi]
MGAFSSPPGAKTASPVSPASPTRWIAASCFTTLLPFCSGTLNTSSSGAWACRRQAVRSCIPRKGASCCGHSKHLWRLNVHPSALKILTRIHTMNSASPLLAAPPSSSSIRKAI